MIPDGEILIHAGDATESGSLSELQSLISWMNSFPHRHKVFVAGNHDLVLDPALHRRNETDSPRSVDWGTVHYLDNSSTTLLCSGGRQTKCYGSPWTPRHGNWAFQHPRAQDVWTNIVPEDTDILITHGPPKAHLDLGHIGCDFLLAELWRVRPRLHVFGHVHEGYGQETVGFDGVLAAYEDVIKAKGGVLKLLWLLWEVALAILIRRPVQNKTLLVNAASVGGLRDEKRRAPLIVQI